MKKIITYLNQYPAYIGLVGAIVGVLLGGLLSFVSLNYSKRIEQRVNRQKHIEELYANFCYSFAIYKDNIVSNTLDEWDMFISESNITNSISQYEANEFYMKRFSDRYAKIHSDNIRLSESAARFNKDYRLLQLFIDFGDLNDYFDYKLDSAITQRLKLLKSIPKSDVIVLSASQTDSLYSTLDSEIFSIHSRSDSILDIIHKRVIKLISK